MKQYATKHVKKKVYYNTAVNRVQVMILQRRSYSNCRLNLLGHILSPDMYL